MINRTVLKSVSFPKRAVVITLALLALSLFIFGASNAAPSEQPQLQQALPQQPYLPLEMALEAASAALAQCETDGHRVTVAVVDQAGVEKVILKGDGAGPHTIASSVGKAFTAASMRRATGEIATAIAENPALDELRAMDERILILAGGLPIEINGEVVGGIGVGGAPGGDLDAACAQAGIEQITGAGN
ncbi:MAG: hypothetical protein BroJett011_07360 [Chloroflexota bacterium]|nr:MAG: hypothetical protein BroJett011_07360 [Chloroflexota bacterium]